uniref:Uncharacterized protein n=1 Tax=Lepeophtheirus salmonis TaxID=72036 RepID=A0A0K2V8M0_LEPSM
MSDEEVSKDWRGMGRHLRGLLVGGRLGECKGSKSQGRLRVTQAILPVFCYWLLATPPSLSSPLFLYLRPTFSTLQSILALQSRESLSSLKSPFSQSRPSPRERIQA